MNLVSKFLLLIFIVACQSTPSQKNKKKVLLISVDGLRPEFYLDKKYQAPTLMDMAKNGTYAIGMDPVFPTVTYPNHTSLVTGVNPKDHGILSNTKFDWNNGPTTEWYWYAKDIKIKTIYNLLEEKGMKTASLSWPVTVGANISYMFPEIFQLPPWQKDSTWNLVNKYSTKGMIKEISDELNLKPFSEQKSADTWATGAVAHIINKYQPELTLLHLTYTDKIQHGYGREDAQTYKAVAWMDKNIKYIKSGLDQNTCVLIVGDHGFIDYKKIININRLFVDRGWIELDEKGKPLNWQVIAHKSGAQAAIYLKDKSIKKAVIDVLIKNQKLGYEVVSQKELIELGAYGDAIAAVSAKPGFNFGHSYSKKIVTNSKGIKGQHGHLPYHKQIKTGFLAFNCGSKKNHKIQSLSNLQIAPTVMKVLDQEYESFSKKPVEL